MKRFLFVGEQRSNRAVKMGVRWTDGRLAARSLFDALEANGIDPLGHCYTNLFEHRGLATVREHQAAGCEVVGMGAKVQAKLTRAGIPHRALVHPAARGRIRRKDRYAAHVAAVLA